MEGLGSFIMVDNHAAVTVGDSENGVEASGEAKVHDRLS